MKVFLAFTMFFSFSVSALAINPNTGEYCFYQRIGEEIDGKLNFFFPHKDNISLSRDRSEFRRFLRSNNEHADDFEEICLDKKKDHVVCTMMVGNLQVVMADTSGWFENEWDVQTKIREEMRTDCKEQRSKEQCRSKITCY